MNEHLCKGRWEIYSFAKELREQNEIMDTYTIDGKVFVKFRQAFNQVKGNKNKTQNIFKNKNFNLKFGDPSSI